MGHGVIAHWSVSILFLMQSSLKIRYSVYVNRALGIIPLVVGAIVTTAVALYKNHTQLDAQ